MRALLIAYLLCSGVATAGTPLTLAGPPASVSFPLIHMIESGALSALGYDAHFQLWKDPDQLRAIVMSEHADYVAMPTNVAANLYNRGVDTRLLNVSTWGILYLLSRNADMKSLADFSGEEITVPFRGDMPDLVFQLLAEKHGLNPRQDFSVRYVASPLDAMQLLIMRRTDHALLAEPAVSMALRKTDSFPLKLVAPDLYRSVNLQEEWGKLFNTRARIPQAGIAVVNATKKPREEQALINQAYKKSLQICQQAAAECADMVVRQIPMLEKEAVLDALQFSTMETLTPDEAEPELKFFFNQLYNKNPSILGEKIPDDAFYQTPDQEL